jgi:hypothetical protein
VLHFQCPHCGTKHETEVQRLASKPFSLEPRNARGISTPRGSVAQSRLPTRWCGRSAFLAGTCLALRETTRYPMPDTPRV